MEMHTVRRQTIRLSRCAFTCGLAVLLAGSHAVAQSQRAAPASLAGTWALNQEASDIGSGTGGGDDDGGPRGGRSPIGGGFGMPGRQPMGGMGSPGGAMGAPRDVDPATRKQRMALTQELLTPIPRMTISQDASLVTFTFRDGRAVRYRTDGRDEKHQMLNGVVETETRWKKRTLVRETKLDDGMTVVETFSIESPRTLVVEVEMRGGPGRRKPARRVYDLVDVPEGPAPLR